MPELLPVGSENGPSRARSAQNRGGDRGRINLDEIPELGSQRDKQLIALNDELDELMSFDPRKARVVELRYFGGLGVAKIAAVLKVSQETVTRDCLERLANGTRVAFEETQLRLSSPTC